MVLICVLKADCGGFSKKKRGMVLILSVHVGHANHQKLKFLEAALSKTPENFFSTPDKKTVFKANVFWIMSH